MRDSGSDRGSWSHQAGSPMDARRWDMNSRARCERPRPGARTASVNEMTERGSWASTFALVRGALASGEAVDPGEAGSGASRGSCAPGHSAAMGSRRAAAFSAWATSPSRNQAPSSQAFTRAPSRSLLQGPLPASTS